MKRKISKKKVRQFVRLFNKAKGKEIKETQTSSGNCKNCGQYKKMLTQRICIICEYGRGGDHRIVQFK